MMHPNPNALADLDFGNGLEKANYLLQQNGLVLVKPAPGSAFCMDYGDWTRNSLDSKAKGLNFFQFLWFIMGEGLI